MEMENLKCRRDEAIISTETTASSLHHVAYAVGSSSCKPFVTAKEAQAPARHRRHHQNRRRSRHRSRHRCHHRCHRRCHQTESHRTTTARIGSLFGLPSIFRRTEIYVIIVDYSKLSTNWK